MFHHKETQSEFVCMWVTAAMPVWRTAALFCSPKEIVSMLKEKQNENNTTLRRLQSQAAPLSVLPWEYTLSHTSPICTNNYPSLLAWVRIRNFSLFIKQPVQNGDRIAHTFFHETLFMVQNQCSNRAALKLRRITDFQQRISCLQHSAG